jgi:hypothetical protein
VKRPSTPTILSVLALVAASGSTATAAVQRLITSRDIKDGTIRLADLSPATKRALRGQIGLAGPAGPAGAAGAAGSQGPAGPPGPAGAFDPSKISYVEGSAATASVGNVRSSVAACPPGTRVLSGGYNVQSHSGGSYIILESRARDAAGWYVTMYPDPPCFSVVGGRWNARRPSRPTRPLQADAVEGSELRAGR